MKKLLTLLGSVCLIASTSAAVVACGNTETKDKTRNSSSENLTSDNDGLQGDDPNSVEQPGEASGTSEQPGETAGRSEQPGETAGRSEQPGETAGRSEQPNGGSTSAPKSDLDDDSAHTLNL
ncbi:hypothetical protein FOY76_03025 [Mycoplasma capricolum subsp. capripneumoniae]|uniref:lipoprotein n=1 Tax=Mycoplasma capricolum TaxID=2095 RepID=UPI00140EFFFA|nr:lipoprotein [Mycoplasma capricolum]QIN43202.1 hypothetical protein FOY63_03030 [Mycoplasma capricolum subsp. capripneumoniae]QIN50758.1 hypothetical protein FOY76_03025 [Mycoplasma capricolum subsp. capripneumoniae]